MRGVKRCLTSLVPAVVLVGLTNAVYGQGSDSTKSLTATIVGHVIDTAGVAIPDAEVVVTRPGDGTLVGTAKSDKRGNATVRQLPAGGPYTIVARKIGYGAARGNVQLRAGDTLYVDFELPALALSLAPITVVARRNRLSIAADQFDPRLYRDALNLVVQQRRDMLGDPEQCPLPDSIFGGPSRDGVTRAKLGRFTFSNDKRSLRDILKRPWLDSLKYHSAMAVPRLPYVQRLYVNGQRRDWTDARGEPIPGRSVVEELRNIPADQIAEIRYVDCWDSSVPPHMQYAVYVTLKPASQAVQDSVLRSIMKRDSVPR